MELSLIKVPREQKQVIRHLMQFYLYDFTKYLDIDVDRYGLFPDYPNLDDYFNHADKYPFLIKNGSSPAGFALVDKLSSKKEGDFYMTEFFVMQKYRRSGVGTWAANELFSRFQGEWKVSQVRTNMVAQAFWRKVIGGYTNGQFRERFHPESGNPSQHFVT